MRTTIGRTAAFALSLTAALALAGCQTPTEDKAPSVPTTSAPSDTTEPTTEESGTPAPGTRPEPEPTTEDAESGSPEATTDSGTDASGTEDDGKDTETSAGDQSGQAGATQVEVVSVFGTDGYPTGAWTIEDFSDQQPIVCSYPSPSVVDQHGWVCGSSAESGLACLDNPLADDEVICVSDPVAHEGFRRKADMSMVEEGSAPGSVLPLRLQLADDSVWSLRSGGAANATPDGRVPFYWCVQGCGEEALWGSSPDDAVDRDQDSWIVRRAPIDGKQNPEDDRVVKAWMVEGPSAP